MNAEPNPSVSADLSGRIAVIAPSRTLTLTMEALLARRGLALPVVEAVQGDALRTAQHLLDQGAVVLISRGKTAHRLREHFRVPVVELRHTFFDCINAYRQALRISPRVAFLATSDGYARILVRSHPFMPDAHICVIDPLASSHEIEARLDELQAQGIEVTIGGLSFADAVTARGLHFVMSDTDGDAAAEALDEALHLLRIEDERRGQRQELQRRYELIQAILDCVSEGIFSVDGAGRVTRLNQVAQSYMGDLACGDLILDLPIGRYFEPALQQGKAVRGALLDIGRHSLTLSIAPVELDGQVIGAVATLQKQTDIRTLERKMRRALAGQHLARRTFADIVGSSPALQRAKRLAQAYASVDSTLIIEGETGTGKELFAQSIHNASARRHGPFVAINCAAFAPGVLESELFGYVRGAFTGASSEGRIGVFELAHTGTLFLDEISETSADIQLKLLRTLQERQVVRIGDDKVTPVDIRIITASNKPLLEQVAKGLFREDFYYRLCVLRLTLPPLRERREDLPELLDRLLAEPSAVTRALTQTLLNRLADYPWPGNVRQLANLVERLGVMLSCDLPADELLDELLGDLPQPKASPPAARAAALPDERAILHAALSAVGGNRKQAAARLGISTATLWRRMRRYLDEDPACFDGSRYGER